jgi:hypothetical protein
LNSQTSCSFHLKVDPFDGTQTLQFRLRKDRRFLRQAQDTESIEVQGQPLPTGRQAEQIPIFKLGVEGLTYFMPEFSPFKFV